MTFNVTCSSGSCAPWAGPTPSPTTATPPCAASSTSSLSGCPTNARNTASRAGEAEAYRAWGFKDLSDDLMDVLGIWARFIYAPLLDDRVRTVADGVSPGAYGRREAWQDNPEAWPEGQGPTESF